MQMIVMQSVAPSSSSCSSVETSIDLEKSISGSDTGDSDNSVGEFASGVGGDADSSRGAKSGQPTVKGRFKECLPFWREEIKAPASILRIIECGYVLPLMQEPPTFQGNNRPSAYKHAAFVEESLRTAFQRVRSTSGQGATRLQPTISGCK